MTPIAPGFTPQFTATPVPVGALPDPAQPVPTWTSSDPTNAPVQAADSTGLVANVAIPTTAPVGDTFTLTVTYTNADGTEATGNNTFTIVKRPVTDLTSFVIAQSA